jgi:hypothetical protein
MLDQAPERNEDLLLGVLDHEVPGTPGHAPHDRADQTTVLADEALEAGGAILGPADRSCDGSEQTSRRMPLIPWTTRMYVKWGF